MKLSPKIKKLFSSHKKIFTLYVIGVIIIITTAVHYLTEESASTNKSNNDATNKTIDSDNTINFEYGRYTYLATNNDGTFEAQFIDIDNNSVSKSDYQQPSNDVKKHKYTISNNIIRTEKNVQASYEIEIIDSTHLKCNDLLFTYNPDNSIICQANIDVLSDEDIQSAIEATREYFSSKPYKISNLSFVEDTTYYNKYQENFLPGTRIVIKASLVGTISNNLKIFYVSLKKSTTNDSWEFYAYYSPDN